MPYIAPNFPLDVIFASGSYIAPNIAVNLSFVDTSGFQSASVVEGSATASSAIATGWVFDTALNVSTEIAASVIFNGGVISGAITAPASIISVDIVTDNLDVSIQDTAPIVSGIVTAPINFGSDLIDTAPIVEAALAHTALMRGAISSTTSSVSANFGKILNISYSVAIAESKPVILGIVSKQNSQTGRPVEPVPTTENSAIQTMALMRGAIVEPNALVTFDKLVDNPSTGAVTELKQRIKVTFTKSRLVVVRALEPVPVVGADIDAPVINNISCNVIGDSSAVAQFVTGGVLVGTSQDKRPLVVAKATNSLLLRPRCVDTLPSIAAEMVGERGMIGSIKELPPIVVMRLNDMQASVTEASAIANGRMIKGRVLVVAINDKYPELEAISISGSRCHGSIKTTSPVVKSVHIKGMTLQGVNTPNGDKITGRYLVNNFAIGAVITKPDNSNTVIKKGGVSDGVIVDDLSCKITATLTQTKYVAPPVIDSVSFAIKTLEKKPTSKSVMVGGDNFNAQITDNGGAIAAIISKASVMLASITDRQPLCASSIIDDYQLINITENKPQIISVMKRGALISASLLDKKGAINVSLESTIINKFHAIEPISRVNALMTQSRATTSSVIDIAPSTKAIVVSGSVSLGNVIDITAILKASSDNRMALISRVVENKPTTQANINQRSQARFLL